MLQFKVSSEPPVDTKVHRPQIVEKVVEVPKVRISVPQSAKASEFVARIRFWAVWLFIFTSQSVPELCEVQLEEKIIQAICT